MKIAVAMSGGIDSSMAAVLLQEQGHEITGITAVLTAVPGNLREDLQALPHVALSREIAGHCGFTHHVADCRDEFLDRVVRPFCNSYRAGKTPNPCIECNTAIKFGRLLEYARSLGCEMIATGHYVRRKEVAGGPTFLSMGRDRTKDQSYFLYRLTQQQLLRSRFPLGEHTKEEVRKMARERSLRCRDNPESQDICFIPEGNYGAYVESMLSDLPAGGDIVPGGEILPCGEIIDSQGHVIGRHRGIHRYTIGQRRGLGISHHTPLYVTAIDPRTNRITAGPREDLLTRRITVTGISRMKALTLGGMSVMVKTRSTQAPAPARLTGSGESIIVEFLEPQFGISPGQSAVFYDDESDLLGGGYIENAG